MKLKLFKNLSLVLLNFATPFLALANSIEIGAGTEFASSSNGASVIRYLISVREPGVIFPGGQNVKLFEMQAAVDSKGQFGEVKINPVSTRDLQGHGSYEEYLLGSTKMVYDPLLNKNFDISILVLSHRFVGNGGHEAIESNSAVFAKHAVIWLFEFGQGLGRIENAASRDQKAGGYLGFLEFGVFVGMLWNVNEAVKIQLNFIDAHGSAGAGGFDGNTAIGFEGEASLGATLVLWNQLSARFKMGVESSLATDASYKFMRIEGGLKF